MEVRNSDRSVGTGGIFLQETPQLLAVHVRRWVQTSFRDLYHACHAKEDARATFSRCMALVGTQWTEDDFAQEAARLERAVPQIHEAFGNTFVLFARLVHKDPSSAQSVSVRLTIPLLDVFVRRLLKHIAEHSYVTSGRFFDADADVVCQTHTCMEAIRLCLVECSSDYVYVEKLPAESPDSAAPAGGAAAASSESVHPDDSASNVGTEERADTRPASRAPSSAKASAQTRAVPASGAGSAPRPAGLPALHKSRHSTITSFEMSDSKARAEVPESAGQSALGQ